MLNWEQKVRGLKEELMELETQKLGLESVLNRLVQHFENFEKSYET